LSENIEVVSIIDRFLEHSRIYIFHNNGEKKYFLASADWMKRNLSRRVEVAFPVYDKDIKKQLQKIFDLQWEDNQKARILDRNQTNNYKPLSGNGEIRSQYLIYELIK
jgi:polyphosphate kinase